MDRKDAFLTGLALIAIIILGSTLLLLDQGVRAGFLSFLGDVVTGIKILFFTGVGLGGAAVGVKIWKGRQTLVIRDGKGDRIARVVVHRGNVVQIGSAEGFGLTELMQMQTQLICQQQKTAQVVGSASTAIQRLMPVLDEYGYEDDEDDRPRIEAAKPVEEYLNISDDYQPHADEFLAERKLVVGISGAGKSNTTATLCEELGRLDVPMILADTENEYESLADRRWLPHGMLIDSNTVNTDNASQFGQYILENNIQAVLNLNSYGMEEAAWVMVNLIAGLKQWQEARVNERRIPCEFLLEEATTWLPQNVRESPLYGTEVMNRLQDAFFNDLVRKGRKRGLGLTVICQKIAEIDKRALQCGMKLLHRQTELVDLEKYAKMGITNQETLSLQDGQGYFFSSKVSKKIIQVRRRYSQHGANTPKLSELRRHQQSRNSLEKVRDFPIGEQPSGDNFRTSVEPLVEWNQGYSSVHSENPDSRQTTVQREVPERTKAAILGLYREGTKRKDIQGLLDLNGDEYWMVKAVCDEYDQERGN
jgi:hypothetical protein